MIYVGLFEKSGVLAREFEARGWRCICLDAGNDDRTEGNILYARCDLSDTLDAEMMIDGFKGQSHDVGFLAAFPPCDHLAVSGARWFKGKGLRALQSSIAMFATAAELAARYGAPYFIENPVSTISTYWRKPDASFHPFDYTAFALGDNYTKKTCIWTGNGFSMPPPRRVDVGKPDDRIHKAPPGPGRKDFRNKTPLGFARAVAIQVTEKETA